MNKKGFAISGMIYAILVLFLFLVFGLLSLLGSRKMVLDRLKNDVMAELNGESLATNYDVIISNIAVTDITSGVEQSNTHTRNAVSMNVDLPSNSHVTYTITLINNSTSAYKVAELNLRNSTNALVTTSLSEDEMIEASSTKIFTITITNNSANRQIGIITYNYYFSGDVVIPSYVVAEYNNPNSYELTIPHTGYYKLETWGAQGGSPIYQGVTYNGGYGGYSTGIVYLEKGAKLYVSVGGEGKAATVVGESIPGGYNGGGAVTTIPDLGKFPASGGGATHIATASGLLRTLSNNKSSVLIVAGGGGGGYKHTATTGSYQGLGGNGGGIVGNNGEGVQTQRYYGLGGKQTTGGCSQRANNQCGGFGYGGEVGPELHGSSGGGGYYGGGGSAGYGSTSNSSGGGGSGYIGNPLLTNKQMVCYNCTTSNDIATKTVSNTCTNETATENCSKQGNGSAKITYIGEELPIDPYVVAEYSSPQSYELTIPHTGYYKLEVWGAQGGYGLFGNGAINKLGGKGGYSSGYVRLNENTTLSVVVGGKGGQYGGGYNGGGAGGYSRADEYSGGGGGATHIATATGLLKDLSSNKSSVLIVAGGGGGGSTCSSMDSNIIFGGGAGGGLTAGSNYRSLATGASQTSSGTITSGFGRVGSFGLGGSGYLSGSSCESSGGGGGGYYGGVSNNYGGTGGSGYIGGVVQGMSISGNDSMSTHDGNSSMTGNLDNGYAKITYIGNKLN